MIGRKLIARRFVSLTRPYPYPGSRTSESVSPMYGFKCVSGRTYPIVLTCSRFRTLIEKIQNISLVLLHLGQLLRDVSVYNVMCKGGTWVYSKSCFQPTLRLCFVMWDCRYGNPAEPGRRILLYVNLWTGSGPVIIILVALCRRHASFGTTKKIKPR